MLNARDMVLVVKNTLLDNYFSLKIAKTKPYLFKYSVIIPKNRPKTKLQAVVLESMSLQFSLNVRSI